MSTVSGAPCSAREKRVLHISIALTSKTEIRRRGGHDAEGRDTRFERFHLLPIHVERTLTAKGDAGDQCHGGPCLHSPLVLNKCNQHREYGQNGCAFT